jgi:hypothetical protein
LRNPPQFPVIIGVTGHRQIAPEAIQPVRDTVRRLLVHWRCHFGPALHVLTALADGADQLVADEARDANVPIIAVAPFGYEAYKTTIANRDKLREHWDRAVLRLTLPRVEAAGGEEDHDRQYEQLGVLLIRRSHLLLALWDDQMDAARGGTRDVMRMRLEGDHGAAVFHDSPMFLGAGSYLDETNRGPVLHVMTPRAWPSTDPPGTCRLLGLPNRQRVWDGIPVQPERALDEIERAEVPDFARIDSLNRAIGRLQGSDDLLFDVQIAFLDTTGIPADAEAQVTFLKRLQAAVDTTTQGFQTSLLGHFVPAKNPWDMVVRLYKMWRATGQTPKFGAVLLFTAALPLAVYFFENYVEDQKESVADGSWFILAYLTVFGGALAWYRFRVRRLDWQERFQDYRALAEAMRVQLYWGIAAIPASVSDHYLRKQSGELGWIQFALRGTSLWAASVAGAMGRPNRATVQAGWIDNQLEFFTGKARLHKQSAERGQLLTSIFAVAGIAAAIALLILLGDRLAEPLPAHWGAFGRGLTYMRGHHGWLIVLTATLPGVAAFFSMSADLRNYEPHAHSYALMRRMFGRTADVLNTTGLTDAIFQDVVREIGREALAENAEWLVEHRHRTIEPR